MLKSVVTFAAMALPLVGLSGCGGSGGGGGSSAPATQSAAQGVYHGTLSNGASETTILLEDGSFWSMYGVVSGNVFGVMGITTGTGTSSNGTFTTSYTDFPAPGNVPIKGSGSGTYTGTTLLGTNTENGQSFTFNLVAPQATTYDYNAPANISAVTGSWTGQLLDGGTATVNIQASGALTGTSSRGCSFTGTIAPRPSGKNIFNISVTFGAAPCALPNQTASGIIVTYATGSGTTQLAGGLVTPTKSAASAFFAVR